jgi:hypothetical protein
MLGSAALVVGNPFFEAAWELRATGLLEFVANQPERVHCSVWTYIWLGAVGADEVVEYQTLFVCGIEPDSLRALASVGTYERRAFKSRILEIERVIAGSVPEVRWLYVKYPFVVDMVIVVLVTRLCGSNSNLCKGLADCRLGPSTTFSQVGRTITSLDERDALW